MSWITFIWTMTAGICLTLGAVHFVVWTRRRDERANLVFSVTAAAAAGYAVLDMIALRDQTPAEYGQLWRWALSLGMLEGPLMAWFIRLYLRAGRLWLLWLICGVRGLMLALNFAPGANFYFREITGLQQTPLLGELISRPHGALHPWVILMPLSFILIILFAIDAAHTAAQRSGRRRAWVLGGLMAVGFSAGLVSYALYARGILPSSFSSQLVLSLIIFMGYELSVDVLRAGQLSRSLEQSEERMRLAASATDLGLWEWDIVKDEIWATENSRARVGAGPSERIDFARFLQSVHPDDRELIQRAVRHSLEGSGEYEAEYRVVTPPGTTRWVVARGQVERDRNRQPLRLRGVSVDVTERRSADQKFRLAVEASPSGIVLVNGAGQIVLVNAQTERLFGYAREELIGQTVERLIPERFRNAHPGLRSGFHAVPTARAMGSGRELFALRKDGTEFPVEIGLSPIHSEEGTLVLTTIVDITARKLAEAELRRVQSELAHVSRVSTMGQLSTALAHELNQPLGAILSNAEAAEMLLDADPPALDQVREILADIRQDDERAGEVIRRMRALLRKQEMEMRPLDLGDLVQNVVRLVSGDAVLRKVIVRAELASSPLPVRGDRVHLQQVLLNLLVNGMDAVAESDSEARQVIVQAGKNRIGEIEVSVSDNGPGIAPELLPRLFEPFFTMKPNGMGMGTSIARTIVQAHNGHIWAENNPGGGATLRFTLPVDERQGDRQNSGVPKAEEPGQSKL